MRETLRRRQPQRDDQSDGNRPYYDKGGHWERGRFWRDQRLAQRKRMVQIPREQGIINRRQMFRDPQSGK